jgi:hypothetical protein
LENPSFQHVEQVEEMQEITNIVLADAKMIGDYARFGEVVVFDTTFGTNKEHRPLVFLSGLIISGKRSYWEPQLCMKR